VRGGTVFILRIQIRMSNRELFVSLPGVTLSFAKCYTRDREGWGLPSSLTPSYLYSSNKNKNGWEASFDSYFKNQNKKPTASPPSWEGRVTGRIKLKFVILKIIT